MLYDSEFLELLEDARRARGAGEWWALRPARALLSNRLFCGIISAGELLVGWFLALPIPIYRDLVLMTVTHWPGSPAMLGNYLRAVYYKRRLRRMGRNVVLDEGVFFRDPAKVELGDFCYIDKHVSLNVGSARIGNRVHIAQNTHVSGGGRLEVGDYVNVAHSTAIVTATDTPESGELRCGAMVPRSQRHVIVGSVRLEDFSFVGMGARILPNVRVGRGAIVAAGALIREDVADWAIVGGVPAKRLGVRRATD